MPKRKANMRKRFFEKIETGSNKGKSGRLWTRKAQRLSKNIGGRIGSEITENLREAYGSKIKFLLKDLQETIKNTKSQKGQNLRRKYLDDKYLKELDKDKSFLIDSKYNLIKGLKSINEVKQELKQENYKNSTIEKFLRPYREILRVRTGLTAKEPSIGNPYNSVLAEEILRSFLKKSEFNQGGLVGRTQKSIGGKIIRGIGDNISKFPQLLDEITYKPVSDKAAQKILDVGNEIKILKDLEKKKKRFDFDYLYDKRLKNYDAIYDRFGGDEDKIDDFLYQEFSDLDNAKLESLENQIQDVKNKALKKIEKRLEVVIQNRTIPELDPIKGDIGKKQIANAAANIEGDVFAQKNKAIILNLAKYIDSPGYNPIFENTYAARKLSPYDLSSVEDLSREIKPKSVRGEPFFAGLKKYMNPLEILESSVSKTRISRTMYIGDWDKPFFVNPEKLYRALDKSSAGTDFLKLRKGTKKFSDEMRNFEQKIKRETYKPSVIQIFIYPTGNGYIFEGNHRLFRALNRNEAEVPVKFDYLAGAERVKGPFSIQNLYKFVNEDKLGFKTPAEYQEYIDEINEQYLIDNYTGKKSEFNQGGLVEDRALKGQVEALGLREPFAVGGLFRLFHGSGRLFNKFDMSKSHKGALGKGFYFTDDKKIAQKYTNLTDRDIDKMYGKKYRDEVKKRKAQDDSPSLYEVEVNIKPEETILNGKPLAEQNEIVREKIAMLALNLSKNQRDNIRWKSGNWWRDLIKELKSETDEVFPLVGINVIKKDLTKSKLKGRSLGGDVEYNIMEPSLISIINRESLNV